MHIFIKTRYLNSEIMVDYMSLPVYILNFNHKMILPVTIIDIFIVLTDSSITKCSQTFRRLWCKLHIRYWSNHIILFMLILKLIYIFIHRINMYFNFILYYYKNLKYRKSKINRYSITSIHSVSIYNIT